MEAVIQISHCQAIVFQWVMKRKKGDMRYQVYINGRKVRFIKWESEKEETKERQVLLEFVTPSAKPDKGIYVGDFQAFPFCLTSLEIESIYKQETSFDRAQKVGSYLVEHWPKSGKRKKYDWDFLDYVNVVLKAALCWAFLFIILLIVTVGINYFE